MPVNNFRGNFSELQMRYHRIEKEIVSAELQYKLALAANRPKEVLSELWSDLENLRRKLKWFSGALKRYAK